MSSIEIVSEEARESSLAVPFGGQIRNGSHEKRRFAINMAMASFLLMMVFGIGINCGYHANGTGKSQSTYEISSESVEAELELGLDTITEWFPAKAAMLSANHDDIIDHIMNVTEPDETSPLQGRLLMVPADRKPTAMSQLALAIAGSMSQLQGVSRYEEERSRCDAAIAHFFSDLAHFVFTLTVVNIEHRLSFYAAIHNWVQESIRAGHMQELIKQIGEIIRAEGDEGRVRMILRALRTAVKMGGSWLKGAFHSMVGQSVYEDNWSVTKMCIKMAAIIQSWFFRPRPFLQAATFHLLGNQSIITSGRGAMHVCTKPKKLTPYQAGQVKFAANHRALSEGFPYFPCTEDGAIELADKYKSARADAKNGPRDIGQLLTDEVTYISKQEGTSGTYKRVYRGRHEVVHDYLKKNPTKRGSKYRNDVDEPVTITKPGETARVTMTFETWQDYRHNTLPADPPQTAWLTCVDERWMIESILVA